MWVDWYSYIFLSKYLPELPVPDPNKLLAYTVFFHCCLVNQDTEQEHHETLLKKNEELKQRINQIRADRAQQEPFVAKVTLRPSVRPSHFCVRSISFEPLVGFSNNFAQMSSMMRGCAVPMFDQGRVKVKVTI